MMKWALFEMIKDENPRRLSVVMITNKDHVRNSLRFTTQPQFLTTLKKKALENTVGKGENASYQHFLLSSQCFLLY